MTTKAKKQAFLAQVAGALGLKVPGSKSVVAKAAAKPKKTKRTAKRGKRKNGHKLACKCGFCVRQDALKAAKRKGGKAGAKAEMKRQGVKAGGRKGGRKAKPKAQPQWAALATGGKTAKAPQWAALGAIGANPTFGPELPPGYEYPSTSEMEDRRIAAAVKRANAAERKAEAAAAASAKADAKAAEERAKAEAAVEESGGVGMGGYD